MAGERRGDDSPCGFLPWPFKTMSAKRDYYEILGIKKGATPEELKKPIGSSRCATTLTASRRTRRKRRRTRSRKFQRHTGCFPIRRSAPCTTSMGMTASTRSSPARTSSRGTDFRSVFEGDGDALAAASSKTSSETRGSTFSGPAAGAERQAPATAPHAGKGRRSRPFP